MKKKTRVFNKKFGFGYVVEDESGDCLEHETLYTPDDFTEWNKTFANDTLEFDIFNKNEIFMFENSFHNIYGEGFLCISLDKTKALFIPNQTKVYVSDKEDYIAYIPKSEPMDIKDVEDSVLEVSENVRKILGF